MTAGFQGGFVLGGRRRTSATSFQATWCATRVEALGGIGNQGARQARRTTTVAPLSNPLHSEACELAERRRNRGQPRFARVPRHRPTRLSHSAHLARQRLATCRRESPRSEERRVGKE